MNLKGITGIGNVERRPAIHAVNIATMAVARNTFLAMLRLNIFGIASIMALKSARSWQGNRNLWMENLNRLWYNLGGTNFDALRNAWGAGMNKKAIGMNALLKIPKQWQGKYLAALKDAVSYYKSTGRDIQPKGIGAEPATTTTATVIAALPVVLQILQILVGDKNSLSESEQDDLLKSYGIDPEEEAQAQEQSGLMEFIAKNQTAILIGGSALAAFFLLSKKK